MPANNIPVYAIVELLMRLSSVNEAIGDYKGHAFRADRVLVKTPDGSINLSPELIMQQFEQPEKISHDDLVEAASAFKPARMKIAQKTI